MVEQPHSEKTRTAEHGRTARNEITCEQFPEDVSARTRLWVPVVSRTIRLTVVECLTVDQPSLGCGPKSGELQIKRARQPHVVVIEESDVFTAGGEQPDVAGPGHALVTFDAQITDAFECAANLSGLVGRGIVDDDDLDVRAGGTRALDGARQHMRATVCRDD